MKTVLKREGKANPKYAKEFLYSLANVIGQEASLIGGVESTHDEFNLHLRYGNKLLHVSLMNLTC